LINSTISKSVVEIQGNIEKFTQKGSN
jgi:hypothetical protein